MEQTADDVLVAKAQAGDMDAFMELAGRVQEKIYHTIFGLTRNREDAGDLTQDTLMYAYRSIRSFRRQSSFYTWVYRIAVNLSLNFLKKKNREKGRMEYEDGAAVFEKAVYAARTPERESQQRELRKALEEAVASLPAPFRAAFNLVVYQGLSHGQAAEILGCSENTVSWRMHKARKILQAGLGPFLAEVRDAL